MPPIELCLRNESANFEPVEQADILIRNFPHEPYITSTPSFRHKSYSPKVDVWLGR